jgi:hypothetical protein
MSSNASSTSTVRTLVMVNAICTLRFGAWVRCASRMPARGTGSEAPTDTVSSSRISLATNAAISSLVV